MTIAEKLRQEGMKIGMEIGMEIGIKKIANNLILMGMPDNDIEEVTGLSQTKIQKLKEEAKTQADKKQ